MPSSLRVQFFPLDDKGKGLSIVRTDPFTNYAYRFYRALYKP